MTSWLAFFWAAGAGLAISILDHAALYQKPKIERPTFSDPAYLMKFFGHPLIGGFLSVGIFQTTPVSVNPITSIAIGAAAPVVMRALMRSGAGMLKLFVHELNK